MPYRLRREDFWRAAAAAPARGVPFKEWHHFIVFVDGLDLLVNFNVAVAGRETDGGGVVVIARTREFSGFVAQTGADEVAITDNGHRARFGDCVMEVHDDSYDVAVLSPDGRICAEFSFSPRAAPLIAHQQPIGGERHLSWGMYPAGAVFGQATIDEQRFEFQDALGYHDHNWGHFGWGDDFCWEWGVVLPKSDALKGTAVVLSSLQNRARTTATLEQLFLWHEGRNVLAVSGPELSIALSGSPPPQRPWHLPKVMSLLRGRQGGDIPGELVMRARSSRGDLSVTFVTESVAQLLVPSDRDPLGVVTIHECVGNAHVCGTLANGEPIEWEGRGVFELVRG